MNDKSLVKVVRAALKTELDTVGIKDADVRTEAVPGTKLRRVSVVAKGYKKLRHSERQNLVWRIVDGVLDPSDRLKISMILTLAPEELGR
jgi:hypothetical protein